VTNMADTGKKGKKKKGKTLNLNEFLSTGDSKQAATFAKKKAVDIEENEQNTAAYDSDEDVKKEVFDLSALPTAPRASRNAVDSKNLPSEPPYTAFLGNLPYDVEENDIIEFFGNLKLEKVRLPRDGGRMRGFGYAEFFDVNSLVKAIELNNEVLKGRRIRVDVAGSAGTGDSQNREESREDRSTDWRKREAGDQDRRPFDRSRDGGRPDRDGEHPWRNSEADSASSWRRSDPIESSRPEPRRYEQRGYSDRSWGDSVADSETTWRKTSPVISEDRRKFVGRESDRRGPDREADSASSWRSDPSTFRSREEVKHDMREQSREDDRYGRPTEERREERSEAEAPRERPRLNLKPRTVASTTKEEVAPSSIFGGARPVDTAVKEKEIEEKMLQERGGKEGHAKENGTTDADNSPSRSHHHHIKKGRPSEVDEKSSGRQGHDQSDRKTPKGTKKEPAGDSAERKQEAPKAVKQYEEPKAPVFVQQSLFSVLAQEDDSSGEEELKE